MQKSNPNRPPTSSTGHRANVERRLRRTNVLGPALNYQLQACSQRAGAQAIILTSKHGLVVANSPTDDIPCESIAATMSCVGSNQFRITTVTCGTTHCVVSARGFQSNGHDFVLCAVGSPNDRTLSELNVAIGGIRRILAK